MVMVETGSRDCGSLRGGIVIEVAFFVSVAVAARTAIVLKYGGISNAIFLQRLVMIFVLITC